MLKAKVGVVAAMLVTALGTKEAITAQAANMTGPLTLSNICENVTNSDFSADCLNKLKALNVDCDSLNKLNAWNIECDSLGKLNALNGNCDSLKDILGNCTYSVQDIISGLQGCKPQAPETNKPETEKPETEKPETEKPETEKPETDKPETEKPEINKPETNKPETNKPETEKPEINKPETETPGNENTSDSEAEKVGRRIVELVNEQRIAAGLAKVEYSAELSNAAQVRAKEIQTSFSHTRPNGAYFSSVLGEKGTSYRICGENIAYGQPSAEAVVNAWMNSPGHRANILKDGFTKLGIGYTQNANGVKYYTQLFTN